MNLLANIPQPESRSEVDPERHFPTLQKNDPRAEDNTRLAAAMTLRRLPHSRKETALNQQSKACTARRKRQHAIELERAFVRLQSLLPSGGEKMSKIEVLQRTVQYITFLNDMLLK